MSKDNKMKVSLKTIAFLGLALSIPTYSFAAEENASTKTENAPIENEHMCKVTCIEPSVDCEEARQVIETLKKMAEALNKKDYALYESFLDDGCTTFDEASKRLIVGKSAVMENMTLQENRKKVKGEESPPVSITIDHPWAQVQGNTAVVNFKAIREVGGKHPYKEVCNATDIFVKNGDQWKRLHFRGHWRKAS